MPEQEKPSYYMIRAKEQTEENFQLFFEENIAAIGWSRVDVRQLESAEDVEQALDEHYDFWSEAAPQVRGRRRNEILRFNDIEEDDRIVVPYHSAVALAEATGEHLYDPDVKGTYDFSNQIRVNYLRQEGDVVAVPRDELSEGFARRLRVPGSTVRDLGEFSDEIERLFKTRNFKWQAHLEAEEEKRRGRFRVRLLHNIREGDTHLRTGGDGLERLVAALLRCEGYDEAEVLPKQTFEGKADADVRASRADRFGEQKLLVQVKHHSGDSGRRGIDQLAAISQHSPERYGDYKLVFVTTGEVSEDVRRRAENQDIEVLDGEEFADWLLDHIDHLGKETRRRLGISDVPELIRKATGEAKRI